eukprot:TRINITY_DN2569_c0_g1_i1.p1 TRINITY_DN2569_c0_g1~~TRINITY_DN2569_c0_g1_i1.p1  ORF type:complete len:877 (+),score=150.01 TRINITY_DN2569_c0_g1_i1:57-2687(+)
MTEDLSFKRLKSGSEETPSVATTTTTSGVSRPSYVRPRIICFGCGQPGHHVRDCPLNQHPSYARASGQKRGLDMSTSTSSSDLSSSTSTSFTSADFSTTSTSTSASASISTTTSTTTTTTASLNVESRLKKLLVQGPASVQSGEKVDKTVELLSEALQGDLNEHCDFIIQTILQCVKGLPSKTPIYGTLVGLLNISNPDFVSTLVKRLHADFMKAVEQHEYDDTRILLRFASSLMSSNVIPSANILTVLIQLLRCIDEENLDELHADCVLYLVLSTLPWAGHELSADNSTSTDLLHLMDLLETEVNKRQRKTRPLFRPFLEEKTADLIDNLWLGVRQMDKDGWKSDVQLRPHIAFKARLEKSQTLHSFTFDKIPSQATSPIKYLRCDLHLFDSNEMGISPIDRLILSEYISDICNCFHYIRKEGVLQILSLPAPYDYYHIINETLFSLLFALPSTPQPPVYCGSLIIDIFKARPKQMPPFFGQTINKLFGRLHDMDLECRDRLVEMFSCHLSNFGYLWPWNNWSVVLKQTETDPQRLFVCDILTRCVRLSYWDRIKQTVPQEFVSLLPEQVHTNFRYSDDVIKSSGEDSSLCSDLLSMVKELTNKLKSHSAPLPLLKWLDGDFTAKLGPSYRLKVFFSILLELGSKSYSHISALLERYQDVIKRLNDSQDTQAMLINLVADFWKFSQQHVVVLLDKLSNYNMVSTNAILSWVFQSSSRYHRSFFWEILHNSIMKSLTRIDMALAQLKQEVPNKISANATEEKKQETLADSWRKEKKDMFLNMYSRFNEGLCQLLTKMGSSSSSSISSSSSGSLSSDVTPQYTLLENRFKQFARMFLYEIPASYMSELNAIFSNSPDRVKTVFTQIAFLLTSVQALN